MRNSKFKIKIKQSKSVFIHIEVINNVYIKIKNECVPSHHRCKSTKCILSSNKNLCFKFNKYRAKL